MRRCPLRAAARAGRGTRRSKVHRARAVGAAAARARARDSRLTRASDTWARSCRAETPRQAAQCPGHQEQKRRHRHARRRNVRRSSQPACRLQWHLTLPSSGRAKGRFAPLAPPLMSNVRAHSCMSLAPLRRAPSLRAAARTGPLPTAGPGSLRSQLALAPLPRLQARELPRTRGCLARARWRSTEATNVLAGLVCSVHRGLSAKSRGSA